MRDATEVIKGRWPEAEKILMKHPKMWPGYVYSVTTGKKKQRKT